MRDTRAPAERIAFAKQVREAAAQAVANARKDHNRWHWDTKQTTCPWGCGDGSGIIGR